MLFSKPGLTLTKALASVAICVSSTAAIASTSTTAAASSVNPCVAGAQGCVLPVGQTPAPVVTTPVETPPVYVAEEPAKGLGILPILAGLALLAAFFLLDPFDLFGDEDEESV